MNEIITNPAFWECECKENYIHSKKEKVCKICKAYSEDCPDARINEC